MARDPLGILFRQIRHLIGAPPGRDGTDQDLVQRFATSGEEAAFAALMERHGPMVFNVCRRVATSLDDAEDAFQATFLVLVRKARSIRKGESVGSWLYGVAYRVAREARLRAEQRRARETQTRTSAPSDPSTEAAGRELRALLDDELHQLPAKYRSPLVLHYLEGKTKEETARQLGWSEGTVSGRLARGRDLLRRRLSRRGLTLTGATLAAALSPEGAAAAVPTVLTESTLRLATLFAAGQLAAGASAARIAALTERVVATMFLSKLKITTAAVLVATAVSLGAGGLLYRTLAKPPAEEKPPGPALRSPAQLVSGAPAREHRDGPLLKVPASPPPRIAPTMTVMALSAQGQLLAMAGADNTVELWEVASGQKLHTLKGHTIWPTVLAFSADNQTLASATGSWLPDGAPGEIKLWDVATGKERLSLPRLPTTVS